MEPVVFKTKSRNTYLFSPSQKIVLPISKSLFQELQNSMPTSHSKEYSVLLNNGYLEPYHVVLDRRLTPLDIKNSIRNLPQVVFEMTTNCNLKCEYCCYGDGYTTFQNRKSGSIDLITAKTVLNYVAKIFADNKFEECKQPFAISFYGGEPLMNFHVIKEIVEYANSIHFKGKNIFFTMTTNALLLKRYAAFLDMHNFKILVSLDGAKKHDDYRRTPNGGTSFNTVYENLLYVKQYYPRLFSNIRFNSVYTDISDANEIIDFFDREFGKSPQFSILHKSEDGAIGQAKIRRMFKPLSIPKKHSMKPLLLMENPIHKRVFDLCVRLSNNVFYDEDDMIEVPNKIKFPTGTCIPFSKRMFITYDGKLHSCEKVNRDKPLGEVADDEVKIYVENITKRFNRIFDNHAKICTHCYLQLCCTKCVLQNQDAQCHYLMTKQQFEEILSQTYSYIEENPEIVNLLKTNIAIK